MRAIFGLVLVTGVALAGSAVYMAQTYIGQTQAALQRERALLQQIGPVTEVFVMKKSIAYGDVIKPEDVATVLWPQNALPEGTFSSMEVLFPQGEKAPRAALRPIEKFEPLMALKVTEPGQPAGLTGQLEKGMRAFAIKVDVSSGVSGFLMPGDAVDIYWTGSLPGRNSSEVTQLIESSVKIIAVDQLAASDGLTGAMVARTVTVAVGPEQVARLAQAQATGRLALSLVGSGDEQVSGKVEVDSNTLLGVAQEQAVVAAEKVEVCTIKTRKGGDVVEIPIPCTN